MNGPGQTLDWELTLLIGFTADEMRDTPLYHLAADEFRKNNPGTLDDVSRLYWAKGYLPYAR